MFTCFLYWDYQVSTTWRGPGSKGKRDLLIANKILAGTMNTNNITLAPRLKRFQKISLLYEQASNSVKQTLRVIRDGVTVRIARPEDGVAIERLHQKALRQRGHVAQMESLAERLSGQPYIDFVLAKASEVKGTVSLTWSGSFEGNNAQIRDLYVESSEQHPTVVYLLLTFLLRKANHMGFLGCAIRKDEQANFPQQYLAELGFKEDRDDWLRLQF